MLVKSKNHTKFNSLLATALILFCSSATFAQTSAESQNRGSDKVDLKKLEDKYWSAKDDDYGVIQNKTFSKGGKFYGSFVYGPLLNDPFAKSRAAGLMLGYYFNEDFGIEASYLNYDSVKSSSVDQFNSLSNADISPDYNLIKSNMTLSATYTPFYAKMTFMNKAILYFDMGFSLGLGTTAYDQVLQATSTTSRETTKETQNAPHFEAGFMQQLFINKNMAFRIDLKNTFYSSKTKAFRFSTNRAEKSANGNDTTLTFGVTLFTN